MSFSSGKQAGHQAQSAKKRVWLLLLAGGLLMAPGLAMPVWTQGSPGGNPVGAKTSTVSGLHRLVEKGPFDTWTAYLSGTGLGDEVLWDFSVSDGRRKGEKTTIPVPSCWEMRGFGSLSYGWDKNSEVGSYRHRFVLPESWKGRQINLVCDGMMTDAEIRLNGQLAGKRHQGAFYRFRLDVGGLLHWGQENVLEVTVWKQSSDASVNKAEREADYWVFGGIFRPVWLEALPSAHISRVEVDAKADGSLALRARVSGLDTQGGSSVQVRLVGPDGKTLPGLLEQAVPRDAQVVELQGAWKDIKAWTAETPVLYSLILDLKSGTRALHHLEKAIGFRTIQVRPEDGVYINDQKVWFKGANRHAFHPESGRSLNPEIDQADILAMKGMNMNAVRMSHYPPDESFLDLCDRLGMYVIDELAGWQKSYDSSPGRLLVQEMLHRDQIHPSIIFWANGNEGGWNLDLDGEFAAQDLQKRPVLHPWAYFNQIDTDHYENFESTANKVDWNIFMPTEFLHGLYDGGAGAGLDDYWRYMGNPEWPSSSGGFLWSLLDEGVKDGGLRLNTAGNAAPDGILGPYREKEASYYTIRDIFSPVQFVDDGLLGKDFNGAFDGGIQLKNNFQFTNLKNLSFKWELRDLSPLILGKVPLPELVPGSKDGRPDADWMISPGGIVRARGEWAAPDIAPGQTGRLMAALPANWQDAELLRLVVSHPDGSLMISRSWQLKDTRELARRIRQGKKQSETLIKPELATLDLGGATTISLVLGDTTVEFASDSGVLSKLSRGGKTIPLAKGPLVVDGESRLLSARTGKSAQGVVLELDYEGAMDWVRWTLQPKGCLDLEYRYQQAGVRERLGISFGLPEKSLKAVQLLADGPQRVYRNRMRGPEFGLWNKSAKSDRNPWDYPEFKGHYARLVWARLAGEGYGIELLTQDPDLFLRIGNPVFPADSCYAMVEPIRGGELCVMDGIPAIGDKFLKPAEMGPQGEGILEKGPLEHRVTFYFTID